MKFRKAKMIQLMTLEEVASYLRVTKKTIYRLLEKRSIPATKVGYQWRFEKISIDEWLRQSSAKVAANILVIDDDETICSLFKDTLEGGGHTVTTATESLKGLELVKEWDYDLIFLDLKMPVMDGVELFRQIRIIRPNVPVTIITGHPDSELMMNALPHGPLVVISKPFNSSDIQAADENYLRFGMTAK